VPELQRLHSGHASAVLAFELANRSYFAASISDRGDEYFDQFAEQHRALLAEQGSGLGAYYVLVAEDGSVLGRFNLYRVEDGVGELGYRVAQHAAGRGLATAAVRELAGLAAARHGLRTLKAATSHDNLASQKVLAKAGFVPVGAADPADIGGKQGTWYQLDLPVGDADGLIVPELRGGIVLRSEEDACLVVAEGKTVSVRYAPQFPGPRRERVLPGHLVAVAGAPGVGGVVVWRWYDALVLGSDPDSVRLWEPAHGEVAARRRQPQQHYAAGTRAYLSAGLPGADWWIAGHAVDAAEDAEVELDEVERLYTEHGLWDSALGR